MPTTTDSPVDTLLAAPEFRPRTARSTSCSRHSQRRNVPPTTPSNDVVCSGCDGLDAIATLTTDPLTAVGLCQCGEVLYRARPEPERGTLAKPLLTQRLQATRASNPGDPVHRRQEACA